MIKDSLASIWRSGASTGRADFVCSAFFVAPGYLLTARHAFDGDVPMWVRPAVAEASAFEIREVCKHPDLDVALVRIEIMPVGAVCLAPNLDSTMPHTVHLNGYFEGAREAPHAFTVLNFDTAEHHYRLEGKQPEGHSGSAFCLGDKVWAMAIRHYKDANVHRGCVIALHQFWPWLTQRLPELATIKPPPGWSEWVERTRTGLAAAFKSPVFVGLDSQLCRFDTGLPKAIHEVFIDQTPATLGFRCIQALIALVKQCGVALRDGSITLSVRDAVGVRDEFLCSMGLAARLCLDPGKLHAEGFDPEGAAAGVFEVPTTSKATATLAMRREPHKAWGLVKSAGIKSRLHDNLTCDVTLELGEGQSVKDDILKEAFRFIEGPVAMPEKITEGMRRDIHGIAYSEALEGRQIVMVANRQLRLDERGDLGEWIADALAMSLLVLREPEDEGMPYLLCNEGVLRARVVEFLELLSQPEWKPT
jgi:hypothetical protein